MGNEEYEKCVLCGKDLLEENIDLDIGVVYGLLFCNNSECSRYLLFTLATPKPTSIIKSEEMESNG